MHIPYTCYADALVTVWIPHTPTGEALTAEGIRALAAHLESAHKALPLQPASSARIVEIGAGSGRLTYLLNKCGLLSTKVVATDPTPQPSAFPVEVLNAAATLRRHRPSIVICAWPTLGEDWTPLFRKHRIDEYIIIGDLGDAAATREVYCHSELVDHTPYERRVLEEVSAELLPIDLGLRTESRPDPECTCCCAVSYRSPRS